MKQKTLKISEFQHSRLQKVKLLLKAKTMDEAINYLFNSWDMEMQREAMMAGKDKLAYIEWIFGEHDENSQK